MYIHVVYYAVAGFKPYRAVERHNVGLNVFDVVEKS